MVVATVVVEVEVEEVVVGAVAAVDGVVVVVAVGAVMMNYSMLQY